MQTKIIEKYFFFGLLLATFIFTFFIYRPFLIIIILGMCFSIVLYPVYKWLTDKKISDWLSALIVVCLFTLAICGPVLGIGTIVFKQSQDAYKSVVHEGSAKPFLDKIESKVNNILPGVITVDINNRTKDLVSYLSKNIDDLFRTVLSAFFSFFLVLLAIFYFLKDGTRWRKAILVLSPLSDKEDEKIITRLTFSINAVMKGYLFIALLQGVLMGVGLWIFHVPNPALWAVMAALASLLPTVGTSLVSIPAIIFLFVTGNTAAAIGFLIWAMVAVGLIDNFLNPFIVGKRMNMPSLLILFSVLGGISLLGPVGILIGPLTISFLFTLISIYRNEFSPNEIL